MTTEYKIGERVWVTNTSSGFVAPIKSTIKNITISRERIRDLSYIEEVKYDVEVGGYYYIGILEHSTSGWVILGKIEEPTLEERISTIEERLEVLDNHVKKYIVDKVDKDVLIDTGAFCSELVNVVKGDDGIRYYLFENGTYLTNEGVCD